MGRLSDAMLGDEAYAHTTDPQTSHAAAESIKPDLNEIELMVYNAILSNGPHGMICDQVVDATGLKWNTVSPRLRPLVRKGMIGVQCDSEGNPITRAGHSERQQIVWFAEPQK